MPSPIWRLKLTQACTYSGTARPARPARLAWWKGKCRNTWALRSTWPTWTGWGERRSGQPWTSGLRQTWRTWWQGWSRTTGYFFLFGVPIQGPNFQPWRRLILCLTVCLVLNLKNTINWLSFSVFYNFLLKNIKLVKIGLYRLLDGITIPNYKLLLFLTTIFYFTNRRKH